MSLFVDALLFRRKWVIEITDTMLPEDRLMEIMRVSWFVSMLLFIILKQQTELFQDRYIILSRYEKGENQPSICVFHWTGKLRCKPYPVVYFHRKLYRVKGKFSIEIFIPFFHFYYEYRVGQYGPPWDDNLTNW